MSLFNSKKIASISIILIMCIFLTGCGKEYSLKKEVEIILKNIVSDPESLNFKNLIVSSSDSLCGVYNYKGKNGGYVDYYSFIYNKKTVELTLNSGVIKERNFINGTYPESDSWQKFCVSSESYDKAFDSYKLKKYAEFKKDVKSKINSCNSSINSILRQEEEISGIKNEYTKSLKETTLALMNITKSVSCAYIENLKSTMDILANY